MTQGVTGGVTPVSPANPDAVGAPAAHALPVLPYADAPTRAGMSCLRTAAGLRLVVSPVRSWRHLSKWYWSALPLAAFAGWFSTRALGLVGGRPDPGLWPGAVEFGCIALAMIAHAVWRLRHRRVFDVTRDEFAVSTVNLAGSGNRAAWPRRAVREIKINPHNRKLLLRISGQDLLEYPLSTDPAAARWAADTLREAVFAGTFVAPGGADAPAPVRPPAYLRWLSNAAVALGMIVGLVGLVLLINGNRPVGGLLIALAIFELMITLGLTFGTQEKDFFT